MLLPAHSKITLAIICLGSLLFLTGALRKSAGKHESQLSVLAGLGGLLFVGLDVCWYFYIRLLPSHMIAPAYSFVMRLWSGVVLGLILYIVHRNAKVLLTVSAVLLVVFNVFVLAGPPAWATRFVGTGNGLFGGMLITSLVCWFDRPKQQNQSDSTIPTVADDRRKV